MATFEERLTAVEQGQVELRHDNVELRQKVELQAAAIGGMSNRAMLERINEKNDKIFQALITHDQFINHQLAELRERVEVQVEGKIVGLQTEVRRGFDAANNRFSAIDTRFDAMDNRLDAMDARFDAIDNRLDAMDARFDAMDGRFDKMEGLLMQVIARLPA